MIVVLLGYMASGKSLVGKELARILKFEFIDLDDYIQKNESLSIKSIFETKGEIYFRKQESHYLNELIKQSSNTVLALGGGTPCYANNMEVILKTENVVSFYLNTTIKTLVNRLQNEPDKRPLISRIKDTDSLNEFIGKHLFERRPYYSQSDHTIKTDDIEVDTMVEEIITYLF